MHHHHCRYRITDIQRWLIHWLRLILHRLCLLLISLDSAWKPFLF
jgi:hypothetical protein